MTSKKWALQLDSDDEEKGANLKEKSSPEECFFHPENSSL